jgi:hypothetical protein
MGELLALWLKQKAAMQAVPYRGDDVQAWGLAFAYVFFKLKTELCARFGIDPEEFSYAHKHEIVRALETE